MTSRDAASAAGDPAEPARSDVLADLPRPRVAMMQPTFLPWIGYFALIASADVFVFLDDFRFTYRSFQHRNRVFIGPNDPRWVTLPVDRHHEGDRATIAHARPLSDDPLYRKILPRLEHAYGKTSGFEHAFATMTELLEKRWESLADLNIAFIERTAADLGLAPRFERSSAYAIPGKRSWRIADLLRAVGARTYLSARGSFGYMRADGVFPLDDIETVFLDFQPLPYPQLQATEFVPYLSVLDALFQVGPGGTRDLIARGTRPFTPWGEMLANADAVHSADTVEPDEPSEPRP